MKTRFCRLSPVVSVARLVTLAAAFVAFAFPASAGVLDDAKFKLDLRGDANANNALDQGEIGNAFDFSATSPSYAVYGEKGVAKPYTCENYPSQTVMRVALPLAVGKTNEQTCIYFPQEPANKYCGITIPKAAVTGDKITMYVRFRPDGLTTTPNGVFLNGFNGYAASGLGFYLNDLCQIGILTPGTMSACNVKLTQGEWYDVFVVATNSADGASTGINIYACKNGASSFSKATLTRTGTYAMSIGSGRALTFGSFESNTPSNPRAFKGAIAEAAIWDRTLSEDEMREVMAGPAPLGGEWQIGAANGSADEFDDADPAAVYDVQSIRREGADRAALLPGQSRCDRRNERRPHRRRVPRHRAAGGRADLLPSLPMGRGGTGREGSVSVLPAPERKRRQRKQRIRRGHHAGKPERQR